MIPGILIIGLLLVSTALHDTQHELGQQLQADLLGQDGFVAWGLAILAIGAVGYVPGLRTTSRYLLLLLFVVVVLTNRGAFANLQRALQQASAGGPAPAIAPAGSNASNATGAPSSAPSSTTGGQSSSGAGGIGGTGISYSQAAELALLFA